MRGYVKIVTDPLDKHFMDVFFNNSNQMTCYVQNITETIDCKKLMLQSLYNSVEGYKKWE